MPNRRNLGFAEVFDGIPSDEETQIAERAETEAKPPENYTPPPKTKRGIGVAMKGAAITVIIAVAAFAGVILSRDSQSPTDENERQTIVAEAEDSDAEMPAEKADFISLDEIIAAAKELALRTPSPDENDAAAAEENAEPPSLDEITATNESALRIPPTDGDIVSAALTAAEITALPSVNETVEIPSPSGSDAARSQYVSIFDALKPEPMNDYDFVDLIAKGTLPQVTEAIDNGANVNASVRGWTTLVYAASSNRNPEVITALAEAGADVNARDGNGVTPLMSAVSYNSNPEIITALVNAGADVNARNNQGSTPLMFAAGRNSNPEVIKTLLALGADPRLKERFSSGNMAIDYARENENLKNTDVISLLNGFE